ncbi:restriction endonuclease subunit S [Finegoldia magna]|uniref:restriction endonuclease subunit S n=1 Tax=Finegoldia magna TaxID=1260 RepID=UPI002901299C|nr:restriction endonuclease subunit S [Finegoldia magna]MDU1214015.1 restriction endonuclease subunit S [Finegoldia magna]
MDKVKKVPEIRFDGFEKNNVYSINLGEVAEFKKGPFGSSLKKEMFVPKSTDTVKVYEQQNAIESDHELSRYYITRQDYNNLSAFTVCPGDIIVSCAGTIGKTYELPSNAEKGIINQALMRIRVYPEKINKEFFKLKFSSLIIDLIEIYSNGSAIKNIPPLKDLKTKAIYCGDQAEQGQIGTFFKNLDEKLELEKEKHEKLINFKKAMLEDMFPKEGEKVPKARFEGFDDAWSSTTIDNIPGRINYCKGNGLTKDDLKKNKQYNPAILYGHIFTEYGSYLKEVKFSTIKKLNNCTYSEEGDLIIPASSTTADNAIVKGLAVNKSEVIYGGDINIIRFNNEITNVFLAYYLDNSCLKERMFKNVQGTTIYHLYLNNIKDVFVQIPSPEEQSLIGNFFKNLDEKIEISEKKIEKIENFKKAMLDKMFV